MGDCEIDGVACPHLGLEAGIVSALCVNAEGSSWCRSWFLKAKCTQRDTGDARCVIYLQWLFSMETNGVDWPGMGLKYSEILYRKILRIIVSFLLINELRNNLFDNILCAIYLIYCTKSNTSSAWCMLMNSLYNCGKTCPGKLFHWPNPIQLVG